MKKPKRKKPEPKFGVGQAVALRKLNDGITEYGVVEKYDPKYCAPYGVQLSSLVGICWHGARELRPLTETEKEGPRRKRG